MGKNALAAYKADKAANIKKPRTTTPKTPKSTRTYNGRRISKAKGYLDRIYTIEYDMHGMIEAYGLPFVIEFAKLVAAGKIDCRQCVDQWAADAALYGDNVTGWFTDKGNTFLREETDLDLFAFEEANVEESQAA